MLHIFTFLRLLLAAGAGLGASKKGAVGRLCGGIVGVVGGIPVA
jgi:hypothetical protein